MRIEIGGQQWSIERVDAYHPGLFCDGDSCRGTTWCGSAEIYLSNELKGDQVARVVMHELAHAYIYSTQAIHPEAWSEEDVCKMFAIYAGPMCLLCTSICQELFPEVRLRPCCNKPVEARI